MNKDSVPFSSLAKKPNQRKSIVGPWRKDNIITRILEKYERADRAKKTRQELREYLSGDTLAKKMNQRKSIVGPWRKDNVITRILEKYERADRAKKTRQELQEYLFGDTSDTDSQKTT